MADVNDVQNASLSFRALRERAGLNVEETARLLGRSARTVRRYDSLDPGGPPQLVTDVLHEQVRRRRAESPGRGPHFRFADLFAGIGGLRRPLEEAGGRCVFTAEWDRFCRKTYSHNFVDGPDHVFAEDIRPYAREPSRIPRFDVLAAGFPCQPFSIAGVSKKNSLGRPHGFLCDTQGTLFYDLAEIVRFHRPPVFLLENVRNLLRHDSGRTFATIMHVLSEELGYEVHYRVLNSAPWVPQKRERLFIVGFEQPSDFNFRLLAEPDTRPVLGDILEDERDVDPKYILSAKLWRYLRDYRDRHAKAGNGFGCSVFGPGDVARTLSARYYKDGSEILIDRGPRRRPRRLTPRECSRLMGFDEIGRRPFVIPVSDTQAYRQFGNSVVVPAVRAVVSLMRPHVIEAVRVRPEIPAQQELPLDSPALGCG